MRIPVQMRRSHGAQGMSWEGHRRARNPEGRLDQRGRLFLFRKESRIRKPWKM